MNPYSIPNFIVSIYILSLGIIVIRANPKAAVNRNCFAVSLFSFGWLFCYGLVYSMPIDGNSIFLAKLGHSSAALLLPAVYYFIISVVGPYAQKQDRYLAHVTLIVSVTAAILTHTSSAYFIGLTKRFWGSYSVGGPLMIAYIMFTFFAAIRGYFIFSKASRVAAKGMNSEDFLKFKYYALAISIFMIAAVDYLPKTKFVNFYPFGWIPVAAFSTLVSYAIIRHRLLGVEIFIRRSYVYSALITIMTLIYLIIIVLSEHFFRAYIGYRSILTALLAVTIFALIFNPLRLRLQLIIDRRFLGLDPEHLAEENIKLKDAVQHQDRLKAIATLAAGMAHEIKNPLTAIKVFAEHLPTKYNDPDFRDKFKGVMVKEVDRVNNIVQQLLDFSKPKDPELKPDSVQEILEETLSLLNSSFLGHRIEVVRDYKAGPKLLVDRNQLKQAFLNLLLNTLQAMPNGGTLTVATSLNRKDEFVVSIADTGVGIPEDQLAHIFDPFFTTKEAGTGLGLSIVHGIVTRHGGKINVQSTPKHGSRFSINLTRR